MPEREHQVHKWLQDLEIKIKVLETLNYRTMGFRELTRQADIHDRQLRRVLPLLKKGRYVKCKPRVKRGQKKEISITERGRKYLIQNKPLEEFIRAFLDAFKLSFSEFYEKGDVLTYHDFLKNIQSPLREFLNKKITNQKDYLDPYLIIHPINLEWLLHDAREAKKQGHYLTANHRYILEKIDQIKENELIKHNVEWKSNVEAHKFTGKENPKELINIIGPLKIVENERKTRIQQNHQTNHKEFAMKFPRDTYEPDERWEIDIAKLMRNFRKASKSCTRAEKSKTG